MEGIAKREVYMKTKNNMVKMGFVRSLSCVLFVSLFTAGTVFAQDTGDAAGESAASTVEESAVSTVEESAASTAEESASSTVEESTASTSEESTASSSEEKPSFEVDDALQKVLDALDNPVYAETLEALKGGEKITEGTASDAAFGLQQALADLGREIEVDSVAGPATFETLNQVMKDYGLDETDTVDAALYADLLPLVLASRDEDGSYDDILREYFDGKEDEKYLYMKGCVYFQTEHYYKALEAFADSHYGDYEERMAACEQPWPESGELWHNSEVYGQDMYLDFQVNSYDESEGMCFEVYTEDGVLASVLFQTGTGMVTTKLPGGNYRIKDATGETWYGRKDAFGRDGHYEYMSFDEIDSDEYLTQLDSGYEYTITINVQEGTPDGTGVGSVNSDWESWVG